MNTSLNENLLRFLSNNRDWRSLNTIQKKAVSPILNGENALILAPTASGKTEAALIPIFSDILDNKLQPTSVLYISPLKALINDMYNRINGWAEYFSLTSFKWHGDVNRFLKDKFSKNPTDFLLTTPESLEVIMMNKTGGVKERIFKNIRYIVIDEIHYFAASDRGVQLNSLLNRISKYAPDASFIGLSATVGNPKLICEWMGGKKDTRIITDTENRKLQYKVFNLPEFALSKVLNKYRNKKILIFANSRRTAELSYYKLKKDLKMDNIFIHHASINRETREENEEKFKTLPSAFMVSTNTLELGIDIGNIDIVVQLSSPNQVSSFSQRIGRSGRKTKLQRTILITQGFNLLVTLAEIMLYHDGTVEDIKISKKSTDILFHQILSSLFEKGEIHYKKLYNDLINCYAFSKITFNEYKIILKEMTDNGLIEINHSRLSLGYDFEKKFGYGNFQNFYAVFTPSFSYTILESNKEVGQLDVAYAVDLTVGDYFNLAGKFWKVTSINHDKYHVNVKRSENVKVKLPVWHSEGAPIDILITNKIYEILVGDFDRKFLKPFDESAREIIECAISNARDDEFGQGILPVEINDGTVYIYTFAGDKANKLLLKIFEMYHDIYTPFTTPVYISFKVKEGITQSDIESIIYDLDNILNDPETVDMLDDLTQSFKKNKFIQYLPAELKGSLKMDLIFDRDALLAATCDKSINFITQSEFRKAIFKNID